LKLRILTLRSFSLLRHFSFLSVALLPFFVVGIIYWSYIFIDPYGLIWGAPPRLNDKPYPDNVRARLLRAVETENFDMVLIGGSTVMSITPAMMKASFDEISRPFNFSYGVPLPADLKYILGRLAKTKNIKRIIVAVDYSLVSPLDQMSVFFPIKNYTSSQFNPQSWFRLARSFNWQNADGALNLLRTGTLSFSWQNSNEWPEFMRRELTAFTGVEWSDFAHGEGDISNPRPSAVQSRFRDAVDRYRDIVDAPAGIGCTEVPAATHVLRPFAQEAARHGIKVDAFFPPYATVAYYDWLSPKSFLALPRRTAIFDQLLTLKRCVVEALDGIPNVAVSAFDNEDWITSNIYTYYDTSHIIRKSVYRYILEKIEARSHVLTVTNFNEFESRFRNRVRNYTPDF